MKVRIDIDSQLWSKFRAKAHHEHLALDEVVTKVVEPALQAYVEPRQINHSNETPIAELAKAVGENELLVDGQLPILDRITPFKQAPPPTATRRCELCDTPAERLFAFKEYKVCYQCWKGGLMEPMTPAPDAA